MQVNKSLLKKIVGLFVVLCFSIVMALSLVACGGKTIESTKIENGQLVITYTDGSVDKHDVVGLTGPQGPEGPAGPQGPQGEAGEVIDCEHSGRTLIDYISNWDDEEARGQYCSLSIYSCEYCDLLFAEYDEEHDYDENVVAATCTTEGYTELKCKDCGYAEEGKFDIVPATGHTYNDVVTAPTCTEAGYTTPTCACGAVDTVKDPVDALGHTWTVKEVVEPTCTEAGYTDYECFCGEENLNQDVTDALGHDYDYVDLFNYEDEAKDVCTFGSYKVGICKVCDFIGEIEFVAPTGHHSDDWAWDVPGGKKPTSDDTGLLVGDCNVCGKEDVTHELPKLGADYAYGLNNAERPANAENKDNYSYSIVVDGQTFNFSELKAHKCGELELYGDANIDNYTAEEYPNIKLFGNVALRCDEYVPAYFVCDACEESITVNVKKDHVVPTDESKILAPEEATCEGTGKNWYLCDECGEQFYVVTEAIGHDYSYTIIPLADGKANIEYVCANDPAHTDVIENVEVTVTISKPATCEEAGEKIYSYIPEGETEAVELKETIDKLDHLFAVVDDEDVRLNDSTIYTYGQYDFEYFGNEDVDCGDFYGAYFICLDCEASIKVKVINAHVEPEDAAEYTVDVAATCETDGYYEFTCTRCGALDCEGSIARPATGHNYSYTFEDGTEEGTKKVTGTCPNTGCETPTVVYDNCTFTTETLKVATCEEIGRVKYIVTLADGSIETFEEDVAITAHKYNNAYINEVTPYASNTVGLTILGNKPANCIGEGEGYFICDVCEDSIKVMVKGPHTGKTNVETFEATCTTDAYTTFDCTVCNGTDIVEAGIDGVITGAYGHVYKATLTVDPTDAVGGVVTITCAQTKCDCDFTDTVDVPALTEWTKEHFDASCQQVGKDVYTYVVEYDGVELTVTYDDILEIVGHNYTEFKSEFTYVDGEVERTIIFGYCADCDQWYIIGVIPPDTLPTV